MRNFILHDSPRPPYLLEKRPIHTAAHKPLVVGWDLSHPPQKRSTVVDAAFSRIFPPSPAPIHVAHAAVPARTYVVIVHAHTHASERIAIRLHPHTQSALSSFSFPCNDEGNNAKAAALTPRGLLSAPRLLLLLLPEDFQTDNSRQQTQARGKGQRERERRRAYTLYRCGHVGVTAHPQEDLKYDLRRNHIRGSRVLLFGGERERLAQSSSGRIGGGSKTR